MGAGDSMVAIGLTVLFVCFVFSHAVRVGPTGIQCWRPLKHGFRMCFHTVFTERLTVQLRRHARLLLFQFLNVLASVASVVSLEF